MYHIGAEPFVTNNLLRGWRTAPVHNINEFMPSQQAMAVTCSHAFLCINVWPVRATLHRGRTWRLPRVCLMQGSVCCVWLRYTARPRRRSPCAPQPCMGCIWTLGRAGQWVVGRGGAWAWAGQGHTGGGLVFLDGGVGRNQDAFVRETDVHAARVRETLLRKIAAIGHEFVLRTHSFRSGNSLQYSFFTAAFARLLSQGTSSAWHRHISMSQTLPNDTYILIGLRGMHCRRRGNCCQQSFGSSVSRLKPADMYSTTLYLRNWSMCCDVSLIFKDIDEVFHTLPGPLAGTSRAARRRHPGNLEW
jgi:hypothetical protein